MSFEVGKYQAVDSSQPFIAVPVDHEVGDSGISDKRIVRIEILESLAIEAHESFSNTSKPNVLGGGRWNYIRDDTGWKARSKKLSIDATSVVLRG